MEKEITTKTKPYIIFIYSSFDSEKPDHKFYCKNKREVVGFMKTVMDNFDPSHVDIMSVRDFNNVDKDQCTLAFP